jgi:hypothetical protein
MTNELGKSDRPAVPAKSPNNAGKPAAEGMEGRGLAKGNLPQQNASRIQSRSNAHYAYYGIAGNIRALQKVHRAVERYWRRMLSSRSWKGTIWWKQFHRIRERFPLLRPKLYLPYAELQAIAVL